MTRVAQSPAPDATHYDHRDRPCRASTSGASRLLSDGQALPDPTKIEAILITGSAAGVYDEFDWIAPLEDFVRATYAGKTPMVGVCFGHQLIAQALGGKARKSNKGWGSDGTSIGWHRATASSKVSASHLPARIRIRSSSRRPMHRRFCSRTLRRTQDCSMPTA
jgi:GMP synthase-like glutamine amidotransferase